MAGIEAARAKGKHLGYKYSFTASQKEAIREKSHGGITPNQLSKKFDISGATIYNALKTLVKKHF